MKRRVCAAVVFGLLGAAAVLAAQETPPPSPAPQASSTPTVVYKQKFPGDPAHSEPEAAALGYMRTLLQAQRDYRKKFGHYASSLIALITLCCGGLTLSPVHR